MRGLLLLVVGMIYSSVVGAQRVHLLSYTITDNEEGYRVRYDSCEEVAEFPRLHQDEGVLVEYRGHAYHFQVVLLRQHYRTGRGRTGRTTYYGPVYRHRGLAVCLGQPYSVERVDYGHGQMTVWLLPLKFHRRHQLTNMRAFVWSTEQTKIRQMHQPHQL